jgi:hypothetical protein
LGFGKGPHQGRPTGQAGADIEKMASGEEELQKLVSRVDFYESCVDQLKSEIPKYLAKHSEINKFHKSMAKALRTVASAEPNQDLQNIIFLYGQKQELLENERDIYARCQDKTMGLMVESETMLIAPLRVVYCLHCL